MHKLPMRSIAPLRVPAEGQSPTKATSAFARRATGKPAAGPAGRRVSWPTMLPYRSSSFDLRRRGAAYLDHIKGAERDKPEQERAQRERERGGLLILRNDCMQFHRIERRRHRAREHKKHIPACEETAGKHGGRPPPLSGPNRRIEQQPFRQKAATRRQADQGDATERKRKDGHR